MIPANIKSLFNFISFLHSNMRMYKREVLPVVNEVLTLACERCNLKPKLHYTDKLEYDRLQDVIDEKFEIVRLKAIAPILESLKSFDLWEGDREFHSLYNKLSPSVTVIMNDFTQSDIKYIRKNIHRYVEFRSETKTDFLSLVFLFEEIDEILKTLADFFLDSPSDYFLSFERDTIQVANFQEAIVKLKQGIAKVVLPIGAIAPRSVESSGVENEDSLDDEEDKKPKLTIDQVALIHAYEGVQITRKNAGEIATNNGFTSGEKLFQKYIFYCSIANRKGKPTPCTPKKLSNKIRRIEGILGLLSPKGYAKAYDEVRILKTIYETEFS